MANPSSVTEVTTALYSLLEPLASEDRAKCLRAALVLLGENAVPEMSGASAISPAGTSAVVTFDESEGMLGPKLRRFLRQHRLMESQLHQIFHIAGETVELIANEVPGNTKKERTINCYLLVGVRNLIEGDEAKFEDKEALEYCQLTGSYDKNNHTTNRQALSNRMSGDRRHGFSLTVPGLRAAAELIRMMAGE